MNTAASKTELILEGSNLTESGEGSRQYEESGNAMLSFLGVKVAEC